MLYRMKMTVMLAAMAVASAAMAQAPAAKVTRIRGSIVSLNGVRKTIDSYVGYPKDAVSRKMLKADVLYGRAALDNRGKASCPGAAARARRYRISAPFSHRYRPG